MLCLVQRRQATKRLDSRPMHMDDDQIKQTLAVGEWQCPRDSGRGTATSTCMRQQTRRVALR